LVTYDTSDEDDVSIGVQLGCAGVIQVLFEPIDPADTKNPIELLRAIEQKQQPAALACLFSLDRNGDHPGTCYVQFADSSSMGEVQDDLGDISRGVLLHGCSFHSSPNPEPPTTELRVEFIPPPLTLVVVGAGNDAIPLVQMATVLGWDARVVDGRNTHAQAERFTSACQVLVSRPGQVLEQIRTNAQTVFVLMTHNYQYDMSMLQALLPLDIPYIGVLGPRKKLDRMLDEIREGGFSITAEMLAKVYGPVGLEIGAETSEEIALSILAEIQAVMRNKTAQSLRNKQGAIHESK
jgi:xanthine/CO dehydrogenase XdhC/CoxF family maturation factor